MQHGNNFSPGYGTGATGGNSNNSNNVPPLTGPRAKCDQVVFEALAKATEIIVSSRVGSSYCHINQSPQQQQQQNGKDSNNYTNHSFPYATMMMSSRFNLTLPENPVVRNILQRWRRALHLPIRLDVYYEHADQRGRELLERWCLEYKVGDIAFWKDPHNTAVLAAAATPNSQSAADPIVQLRHVCKKIVIWLRTLYCFTRLLPSVAFLNASTVTNNNSNNPQRMSSSPYHPAPLTPEQLEQQLPIGFSLYAVSEDSGDIAQLKEQGFLHHRQPTSTPLTTPYGELSWQVLYAPNDTVERLVPKHYQAQRSSAAVAGNGILRQENQPQKPSSTSPAIPIQEPPHFSNHFGNQANDATTRMMRVMNNGGQPQTAPAHMNHYLLNRANESNTNQNYIQGGGGRAEYWSTKDAGAGINHLPPQQNTYNPRMLTERRSMPVDGRDIDPRHQQNVQERFWAMAPPPQHSQQQHQHHGLLQRRHTSIVDDTHNHTLNNDDKGEKPHRVRSGLSLALMMSDSNNHNKHNDATPNVDNGPAEAAGGADENHDTKKRDAAAAEKRRAALHQMPPHLLFPNQQSQPPPPLPVTANNMSISNEYGYAYNNHIPWDRLKADGAKNNETALAATGDPPSSSRHGVSTGDPTSGRTSQQQQQQLQRQSSYEASPYYLGTTPPSGAFLNTTMDPTATPPIQLRSLGHLLPPRRSSSSSQNNNPQDNNAIAPPFAPRPPGFSQDHLQYYATAHTSSPQVPAAQEQGVQQQRQQQQQREQDEMEVPPLTSLDMLHHSPFHFVGHGGSMLSSLSGGPAVYGSEAASLFYNSVNVEFRKSSILGGGSGGAHHPVPTLSGAEEFEEMPFAVEDADITHPSSSSTGGGGESHLLASSAAVASFAQKCSMHQRLELFDRSTTSKYKGTTKTIPADGTSTDEEQKQNEEQRQDGNGSPPHSDLHNQDIDQLADQLADLRSFGESLRFSVPSGATS